MRHFNTIVWASLSSIALLGSALAAEVSQGSVDPAVTRLLADRAEPVQVWVMFTTKQVPAGPARSEAFTAVESGYARRAIERRRLRRTAPGMFDERDLPVPAPYLHAVRSTGVTIRVVSRWFNAVSVTADGGQIKAIANLPFVKGIRLVNRGRRIEPVLPKDGAVDTSLLAEPSALAQPGALNYGSSQAQLAQINVIAMHNLGYSGAGVVLGVLDTGFYKDHESIQAERILAEWDFIHNDGNTQNQVGDPSSQHNHGTSVVSTAAGRKDGTLYGPAYEADLILCKTEDISQEVPIEEDWFVGGLEFAEAHGADVITSSLGYIDWYTQSQLDGETAVTTVAVNIATANGVIVCTAAGNSGGPGPSLIAPADAFKVITVGAVDSSGFIASFSSRGPAADGRPKPEVVARGVSTYLAQTGGPSAYGTSSGTSFATPLTAGAVCLLVQAHPDWSVEQMRAALFRTADYFVANGVPDPSNARGYGLINTLAASMVQFVPGDFDLDSDVDVTDYTHFAGCMTGSDLGPPDSACRDADLDGDDDVDLSDFGTLQGCFSGPDVAGDPGCAG